MMKVAINNDKNPLFTLDERVALVKNEVDRLNLPSVEIKVHPFKKGSLDSTARSF